MFRNKRWLWYFATVLSLSVLAIVLLGIYTRELSPPVTAERLAEAREKWDKKGLRSYVFEYVLLVSDDENNNRGTKERYVVEVQDGEIVRVSYNDEDLSPSHQNAWTVGNFFDLIETSLQDKQTMATASFQKELGYPTRYVRRSRQPKQRIEVRVVKLEPPKKSKPNA